MVRRKLEMKKIENTNNRQVTFSKRKKGLMKKADELVVLCDAEVAVIVYSNTGKLYEFANPRMDSILTKYKKVLEPSEDTTTENVAVALDESQPEGNALKAEIAMLHQLQDRLMGEIEGLSLKNKRLLEHHLTEALLVVKDRKGKHLMEQLETSQLKEEKAMLENELLREEIEELKRTLALKKKSVVEPDSCLRLGLPEYTSLKLITPDEEKDVEDPTLEELQERYR